MVVSNINHKYVIEHNAKAIQVHVSQYANDECVKEFWPFIRNELLTKKSTSRTQSIFLISQAYKLIDIQNEDIFYTLFILNGPKQGQILNRAWSRIEKLSQDYTRRKNVLNYLEKQIHLPDNVFSYTPKKRKIYIKYFSSYFPEYLKLYSNRCINYLEGIGNFPRGNPTLNCSQFMSTYKQSKLASDKLILRYSGAKKF